MAIYTPPAERICNWTPGTHTGVPGGIPTSRTNEIDITASPYFASGSNTTTSGTITSGSPTLTVGSATSFAVGQKVKVGYREVQDLEITSGASSSGNIYITFGVTDNPVSDKSLYVAVESGFTATQVADAIRATLFAGWTCSGTGATVRFTCVTVKDVATVVSFPTANGVSGTGTLITNGVLAAETTISNIVGTTVTLGANASASITGGTVEHTDGAAIQAAIDASSANDIIVLPAGTYNVEQTLTFNHFQDNRTIRGAGNSTIICLLTQANFVSAGGGNPDGWNSAANSIEIVSALTQGAQSITVGSTTGYAAGDIIQIALEKDLVLPAGVSLPTYEYQRRQLSYVTDVPDSTTIEFFPPLFGDYTNTPGIVGKTNNVIEGLGIEDVYVDASNSTGQYTVRIGQGYGCWIKGVKTHLSHNYGIFLENCVQCEVRENYVDALNHGGNNGAGLLMGLTSASLIEDNIFYDAFPHLEINSGCAGNVIAYNLFQQNYQSGIMGVSIDSNHAAHNAFNLFEGNVSSKFQCDGYYGGASEDTLFRNWFHATCNDEPARSTSQFGIAIFLNRLTRNYNIVGNILGRSGESNQQYINVGAAGGYDGTSTTSITIGTGTKVFTTQAGLNLTGTDCRIWSTSDPTKFMVAHVSYSGTTLTLDVYQTNGSGTFSDWTFKAARGTGYSERYMLSFGLPNIGNGNYVGMAEHSLGTAWTWSDWAAWLAASPGTGPNANGFQEYDFDVFNTTILKGNYNYATASIPAAESLSGDTLPESLYRSSKPSFFGALAWPAFEATSPGTPSYEQIPAGYRFINDTTPPPDDTVATPTVSPAAGTYSTTQSVTFACATGGATMRYTSGDGSQAAPTNSTGTVYSGAISVAATTTFKIIAYDGVLTDSAVRTATFTIEEEAPAATGSWTVGALTVNSLTLGD